jgi:hypothetical protein
MFQLDFYDAQLIDLTDNDDNVIRTAEEQWVALNSIH